MGYPRRAAAALALLGPFAACDVPSYETERRQLGLMMDDFNGGNVVEPLATVDAVVGTRLCPRFDGWYERDGAQVRYHVKDGDEDDDGWLRSCFAVAASGAARLEGECLVLEAPGDAAIELTPRSCATQEDEDVQFTADRMPIASWALADVVLRYDDLVLRHLHGRLVPGPAAAFPPAELPDPSVPMRVIAGVPLPFALQTFAADEPLHPVGYDAGVARAVGENVRPELQQQLASGYVELAPGDRFAVELELAAGTLMGGDVVAADADEAASLELVVGYEPCESCELGWGAVALAQAIVRDAAGARLYGAPIQLSSENVSFEGGLFPDAAELDGCGDAVDQEVRSGKLRAQYRDLVAEVALQWECPAPDADDEPDVVHDDDDDDDADAFDCACRAHAADGRSAALGMLGVVALGFVRRRRAATRPSRRAPARTAIDPQRRSDGGT